MSILDRGSIDWLEARVLRYLGDAGIWYRVLRQCDLACQQHGSALRSELVSVVDGRHRSDAEEIRSAISREIARQLADAGVGPSGGPQAAPARAQQATPS
eukprot:14935040-Alexandrium_andersonii.AAC.1